MIDEAKLQLLMDVAMKHREKHACSAHPYQNGHKLAELVERSKPLRILEIGTGAGYSTLVMALAHEKAYIDTIDKDAVHAETAKKHFEQFDVHDRVNIIVGEAESLLPITSNEYDFIFFDGYGIHYEYLANYHRLLKNTGLLVVANNHLGSRTSDQFFKELHDPELWSILEVFDDTTVAKKSN